MTTILYQSRMDGRTTVTHSVQENCWQKEATTPCLLDYERMEQSRKKVVEAKVDPLSRDVGLLEQLNAWDSENGFDSLHGQLRSDEERMEKEELSSPELLRRVHHQAIAVGKVLGIPEFCADSSFLVNPNRKTTDSQDRASTYTILLEDMSRFRKLGQRLEGVDDLLKRVNAVRAGRDRKSFSDDEFKELDEGLKSFLRDFASGKVRTLPAFDRANEIATIKIWNLFQRTADGYATTNPEFEGEELAQEGLCHLYSVILRNAGIWSEQVASDGVGWNRFLPYYSNQILRKLLEFKRHQLPPKVDELDRLIQRLVTVFLMNHADDAEKHKFLAGERLRAWCACELKSLLLLPAAEVECQHLDKAQRILKREMGLKDGSCEVADCKRSVEKVLKHRLKLLGARFQIPDNLYCDFDAPMDENPFSEVLSSVDAFIQRNPRILACRKSAVTAIADHLKGEFPAINDATNKYETESELRKLIQKCLRSLEQREDDFD